MRFRHITIGVAGAIALVTLTGCAATSSPDSSSVERGDQVSVPILDNSGLGTEFKAVDRTFDTLTVQASPNLEDLNISMPVAAQQSERSLCTVATFNLPDYAKLVSGRSSWDGTFSVLEPKGIDQMPVQCVSRDNAEDTDLAEAWDATEDFLSRDSAKYTVNVEVPLTEVVSGDE